MAMGFAMELDARNNILRVTVTGYVGNDNMRDTCAEVAKNVAPHEPCRTIIDISGVAKLDVSTNVMWSLARHTPAMPEECIPVLVAPEDLTYGMGRMFQLISECSQPNVHVVRTLEEAYRLLKVESPEFAPVKEDTPD
jgi:hypothetical protein